MPAEYGVLNATEQGVMACRAFAVLKEGLRSGCADAAGLWSYPALLRDKDGEPLWLCLVLGTVPMPAKKRTALFRPKAMVLAKANLPEIVRYENFRSGHDPFPALPWDKPVAMFPHKAVWNLTQVQFQEAEYELLTGYAEAGLCFRKGAPLPRRFRDLYLQLQNPVLLGYLKCLAPEFLNALDVTGGFPSDSLK